MKSTGIVYLVGAGPWDIGLITARAAEVLQRAESVVYDYLANPKLLDLAPPDAEKIYVGKKGTGEQAKTQEETNALLVELAGRGKRIVRLKGGDPYVFGRGGEEAEVLAAAGVPFEVVPGITAAFGASAWSGIPLTHREYTSTVGNTPPPSPSSPATRTPPRRSRASTGPPWPDSAGPWSSTWG
jgi:uroporphyrinogen III methyltransferase/synthase